MDQSSNPNPQRAVVLGASLAGLLAARVLSESFAEVVLLERDTLPTGAAARKGTPQAVHPHGLLAHGREVLEGLFPGFTQALLDQGALAGDLQRDVGFDANRQRLAAGVSGHLGLAVSRLAIEAEVRRRVLALPGVRLIDGVDVQQPQLQDDRVVAARYTQHGQADAQAPAQLPVQALPCALTVDCLGRASRSTAWLAAWGFEAPAEEKVEVGICYTSAYYRREGALALSEGIGLAALLCTATPELPRPAVMLAQEPGADGVPRWVVGLGGYAGDHAAATPEGMRERALQIGSPELVKLTHEGTQIGDVIRYVYPHSLRRRYERLKRFPQGWLVMGDALATFNPIYGQGMTVAACEALVLRDTLRDALQDVQRSGLAGLAGLHSRFFKAAAKVIDVPWQLAVGGDLAIPSVPGPRPLPVRVVNAYVARVYRVAPHDPEVALAFLKVVHMVKPPPTLFAPGIFWRVMWKGGRKAGAALPAAGQPAAA